mgnify:FL=1|jgi:ribosomal protein L16 Arg81 hydroxylase|tara:strand:+ start:264 stop:821 length:558 start_codon:yes stop_codon:yes gene_type:complete
MADIFEEIIDESEQLETVKTKTMTELSGLVRRLRNTEQQIEDAEQHLKSLKQEKQKLSTESLPDLMDEMGVERIDVDGLTVTKKQIVAASIPVDKREEAFAWLRQRNLDHIIKNDVICSFQKGQDNLAKSTVAMLKEKGFNPNIKTHIHPQTLKGFLKTRIEEGQEIDLDLFGAFLSNTVDIRRK